MLVRSSNAVRSSSATTATTIATSVILRTSTSPIDTGRLRDTSAVAGFPSAPNQSSAIACSRNATAKVATSITAGD